MRRSNCMHLTLAGIAVLLGCMNALAQSNRPADPVATRPVVVTPRPNPTPDLRIIIRPNGPFVMPIGQIVVAHPEKPMKANPFVPVTLEEKLDFLMKHVRELEDHNLELEEQLLAKDAELQKKFATQQSENIILSKGLGTLQNAFNSQFYPLRDKFNVQASELFALKTNYQSLERDYVGHTHNFFGTMINGSALPWDQLIPQAFVKVEQGVMKPYEFVLSSGGLPKLSGPVKQK